MSSLTVSTWEMPAATLGRCNPLPDLARVGDAHGRVRVDETVSAEEARYMGWGRVDTILPYTLQDQYDRVKRKRAFKSIVLENEFLRATFLPTLGGRLWSLLDKTAGRELLHVNPVFQPCNLGLRNAWFSGGVEWNAGIIGHTPFTADDMACERLTLSDGTPVLRMMQYERVRRLFYRVEAFLPDGARQLYVRVRIDNATAEDTAVYWWSNMAVNEDENVRVIVPAHKAFRYGYGGRLSKTDVPLMCLEADKPAGDSAERTLDVSHPTELPQSMDFFFDVPKDARPFIAALDGTGYGMCQTSTQALRGRKLFAWGMGAGGRHWQEFLSEKGSAYIELQSGLARTQLEHLPMAGLGSVSWLESYGALQADAKTVHGADWDAAVRETARRLEERCDPSALEALHAQAARELDGQSGAVLHKGMGFAWAEKALLGEAFHMAGLSLKAMRRGMAEATFLALAQTGALPCPAPDALPKSYAIGKHWEKALTASIEAGKSDHWYGWYQLGVMQAADGRSDAARASFERSLARAENPWALRCLAVLDARAGQTEQAADRMVRAARMKPIRPLILEALDRLYAVRRFTDMLSLMDGLPASLRRLGRVKVWRVAALEGLGRSAEALALLSGGVVLADVREGEVLLTELWFRLMAVQEKGSASEENVAWAREALTPPSYLDFRMR